jgi:hypothetical protein
LANATKSRPLKARPLLAKSRITAITGHMASSILPDIKREYVEAYGYVLQSKDRAGTRVNVSGGADYSDPTADTALDQSDNIEELKRLGRKIENLEKDAKTILSRLKGVFDSGPIESRRTDGHIPTAEEEHQRQQAMKAQMKRALQEEKGMLEKRLAEIERTIESA